MRQLILIRSIILTVIVFISISYKSLANNSLNYFNNSDTVTSNNISIPNAFSPNGDGVNDNFRIINLGNNQLLEFRIFNRWGTTVYKSESNLSGWDGNYKNQAQPAGTYGFIIKIEDKNGVQSTYKGTITLIR